MDNNEIMIIPFVLRIRPPKLTSRLLKTVPATSRNFILCSARAPRQSNNTHQSKCTWTFHKNHFMWKFTGKMPYASTATPVSCEPAQSKCTWTFPKGPLCVEISHVVRACAIEIRGHFTRAILCGNLQGKCRALIPGTPFHASLRSRNAHGQFTRAILCRNLQGIGRTRMIPPRMNIGP